MPVTPKQAQDKRKLFVGRWLTLEIGRIDDALCSGNTRIRYEDIPLWRNGWSPLLDELLFAYRDVGWHVEYKLDNDWNQQPQGTLVFEMEE